MAYNAKTDWKYDDNITEDDVNRWEQGIADAHDKADQAEQNAKQYTDQKVADIEVPVTSVNNKTGDVTVTKQDVGLGNVTNDQQATKTEFDAHKADEAQHGIYTDKEKTNIKYKLVVINEEPFLEVVEV